MKVIKRDGRITSYDANKVINAISKAFIETDGFVTDESKNIINTIQDHISKKEKDMNVEDIQDLVEKQLMISKRKDVAKRYIIYRNERTKERDRNSRVIQKVKDRNNATNIVNANANVDEKTFSGREKEASSDVQKYIALELDGLSEEVASAHKEMKVYQHDLEKALLGEHNCLNLNFQETFSSNGFSTRNGDVRPPSSFSTACQLAAVAFQCQSQVQFGGVGSIHLDYDLAPYVKKSFIKHYIISIIKSSDDFIKLNLINMKEQDLDNYILHNKKKYLDLVGLSESDIYIDNKENLNWYHYNCAMFDLIIEGRQSAQGLYHNLNTLESRQGSQVPFTSINIGRNTTTEGRLVIQWLMEASINGIGKHHLTSIFPISIFQYKQGTNVNKGDRNYDLKLLALESMSKRIYPNWCNCDWSEAHEDESNPDTFFSTMGCRTLVGFDRHGLGYIRQGRGNNVPNTIILPKLGIEHGICLGERENPDIEGFWEDFEDTLKLTEKGLIERYNIMKVQSPKSAPFMYLNNTIQGARECVDTVENALKHNTLAIGYIGIAEMCQALFGKNHAEDKNVHEFALSVVKRINEFAKEASDRNDLNFSCYATPAEGLCSTALEELREQYGVINNVTSHDYLTNSHHVPVWEKVSIYDKLRIEAPFCKYPTGGCITYVELSSTFVQNLKAVEDIIDYAFKELDIPYLAFNFPIDTCLDCGFQGEMNDTCVQCGGNNILHLRRVTGYLTVDYHNFNKGKQAEVEDRVKHSSYKDMGVFTKDNQLFIPDSIDTDNILSIIKDVLQ